MKKILLLLIISVASFAQDPQNQKAKSVEQILEIHNKNQYYAITHKSYYLNAVNLRNGKSLRFYEGDILRFKTKNREIFQEEIDEVNDTLFSVSRYNSLTRHVEIFKFKPDDIAKIYKQPVQRVKFGLPLALLGALGLSTIYDYLLYNITPTINSSTVSTAPYLFATGFLVQNRHQFFNRVNLKHKYKLKIFKAI